MGGFAARERCQDALNQCARGIGAQFHRNALRCGWMRIDTANVYFDHPYHAPFSHALAIDFVCEANGM